MKAHCGWHSKRKKPPLAVFQSYLRKEHHVDKAD
jgi:hypothetical protein